MRTTIDHGIDLGTTNSAIARREGTATRILTGSDGAALLPSCVHVTPDGAVLVGEAARRRRLESPADTALEFKRNMGTGERHAFPASGRALRPEDLSAEVLRALCARAEAASGEPLRAAVITVPAMFQLPQCDATTEAARLAGIVHAPLLQEPIAAAIAHAGTAELGDGHWLVYDLGGGTFDVSLVRSRAGRLQVLDHDGDNHLGGRDLDRAIARHASDRVRREGRLGEFRRSDPALARAHALLRAEAERVRIQLSTAEQADFRVDALERTPAGEVVGVRFTLDRGELEGLVAPLVARTVARCRAVLDRNRLSPGQLRGVVLVGGPTRTPCVLAALRQELGMEGGHRADPMTAVALGAALFASTQKLPAALRGAGRGGPVFQLEFEPMTTNPEPSLVGRLESGDVPPGARVEARRDDGETRSAEVGPGGAFVLDLALRRGQLNAFELGLRDREGRAIAIDPDRVTILHGLSVGHPPLSQSVGVMLAGGDTAFYLRRGATLPARATHVHATTRGLARGQSGEAVVIPLVQGESVRADRNKVIGVLRIVADRIARDLPAGSEVRITLSIDESARTRGSAYVPLLDQTFDEVVLFQMENKAADAVGSALAAQRDRLAQLESLADELSGSGGGDARVEEIAALLEEGDRDSVDLADQMVRLLSDELDRSEREGAERGLSAEWAELRGRTVELLDARGTDAERRQLAALDAEFAAALVEGNVDLARSRLAALDALHGALLVRFPEYWQMACRWARGRLEATGLAHLGRHAIQRSAEAGDDVQQLAAAFFEMMRVLPEDEKRDTPEILSHVR